MGGGRLGYGKWPSKFFLEAMINEELLSLNVVISIGIRNKTCEQLVQSLSQQYSLFD